MKIALGVEYLGTDFYGWQIQKSGLRTVQGVVEPALSKIALVVCLACISVQNKLKKVGFVPNSHQGHADLSQHIYAITVIVATSVCERN